MKITDSKLYTLFILLANEDNHSRWGNETSPSLHLFQHNKKDIENLCLFGAESTI